MTSTPLSGIDFYSPQVRANPQAIYAIMRETDPVFPIQGLFGGRTHWVLTRYDDCVAMLKHTDIGKEFRRRLPVEMIADIGEDSGPMAFINGHLLDLDPPDHTRLRALVHKAFTPGIVEKLRPRIQAIADDLLDRVEGKPSADLIADYGFPLPIIVIAELIGIPAADRDRFRAWTKQLLFGRISDEVVAAALEFIMYMSEMIALRRADPQPDLLSSLISATENGEQMNEQELMRMLFLLLVAGHETTVNLIGNGTLALLQHPDQLEKLQRDPTLIRSAIEEMLRFNGPVETTTLRWVFEDVSLGGKVIPKGDLVLASLLAANRDPAHFVNPDVFDITREPNRHIAFGNGIHYCVGAPLARMEGAIAISTLLRRQPNIHLPDGAEAALEWSESILLHGVKALPVGF